jgi:cobalt/nickel transport protein
MRESAKTWNNWGLILGVIFLAIAPLFLIEKAEFGGADGQAAMAIQELKPDYRPWFKPLLEPASGEIASLLFAVQAALGAGTIGFVIGLYRGRNEASVAKSSIESSHDASD